MATVQLRNDTEGRAYFDRRKSDGKTSMEAMRALKRRLSNIVYRAMLDDAIRAEATGPGGQRGSDSDSSATGSQPQHRLFGQATPGPVTDQPRTPCHACLDTEGSQMRMPLTTVPLLHACCTQPETEQRLTRVSAGQTLFWFGRADRI